MVGRNSGLAAMTACVLLAASGACAADPAPSAHSLELAQRYYDTIHFKAMLEAQARAMRPIAMDQAKAMGLEGADAAAMADITDQVTREMYDALYARIVPMIAETYTDAELQSLIDFYGSPQGQVLVSKSSGFTGRFAGIMREAMPQVMANARKQICERFGCPPRPPKPS